MSNIVDIKKPEKWRDAVATLRLIADGVENGTYGDIRLGIVAILDSESGQIANFGFGPDADDMAVIALFSIANQAILRDIMGD